MKGWNEDWKKKTNSLVSMSTAHKARVYFIDYFHQKSNKLKIIWPNSSLLFRSDSNLIHRALQFANVDGIRWFPRTEKPRSFKTGVTKAHFHHQIKYLLDDRLTILTKNEWTTFTLKEYKLLVHYLSAWIPRTKGSVTKTVG